MGKKWKKHGVDTTLEKDILFFAVGSKRFLYGVYRHIRDRYFKVEAHKRLWAILDEQVRITGDAIGARDFKAWFDDKIRGIEGPERILLEANIKSIGKRQPFSRDSNRIPKLIRNVLSWCDEAAYSERRS